MILILKNKLLIYSLTKNNMKIKLDNADKIALVWIAAVTYTIGIIPTVAIGWVAYFYREQIKDLVIEAKKESFKNKIKNLFR